jgi:tRNA-2-methylthio-N6-dimethylallyladenosine synthase
MIEGAAKAGPLWSGRTARNEIVHVEGAADRDLVGEVLEVRILRANKHSLHGELTEAAKATARRRPVQGRRALPVLAGAGSGGT